MARTITGWGTVQSEAELFARIDAEIGRQQRQANRHRNGDIEATSWMLGEGYSEGEIMETLGISRRNLRAIMRLLDCETENEEEVSCGKSE